MHGHGVLFRKKDGTYEGCFENGLKHGLGKFTYLDKTFHVGNYE